MFPGTLPETNSPKIINISWLEDEMSFWDGLFWTLRSECFTKHPLKNGGLRFQVSSLRGMYFVGFQCDFFKAHRLQTGREVSSTGPWMDFCVFVLFAFPDCTQMIVECNDNDVMQFGIIKRNLCRISLTFICVLIFVANHNLREPLSMIYVPRLATNSSFTQLQHPRLARFRAGFTRWWMGIFCIFMGAWLLMCFDSCFLRVGCWCF